MTVKRLSPQHYVIDVFLWCLAAIYLFAFTSLYVQIPGLYGKDGILPAYNVMYDLTACVDSDQRCPMWQSWGECKANKYWMMKNCRKSCDNCKDSKLSLFLQQYNLLLFTPELGLDTETGMEFLSLIGMILSILMLVFTRMRNIFAFSALFILYYSQHKIGQIFLWYQWDALLLETGFLAIIISPCNFPLYFYKKINCLPQRSDYSPQESVSFWLTKWLLFRLMFSSGVVKLSYIDRTWWDLTALNWHYESQCIPQPLAWYCHHLPEWFQKLSVVITYVIEIAIPFLFFAPVRCLRLFACFSQIFLQFLIYITGNYNFFNLLTIVLCLSLLDDKFFGKAIHEENKKEKGNSNENQSTENAAESKVTKTKSILNQLNSFLTSKIWSRIRTAYKIFSIITVAILFVVFTVKWFSLKITSEEPIQSKVAFSLADYFTTIRNALYLSIPIGLFSLIVEIIKGFFGCLKFETRKERIYQLFKLFLVSVVTLTMFGLSLILYTGEIDKSVQKNMPEFLNSLHDKTYQFEMVHSYGLFRSMTGIGGRPEVIIKGSESSTGPWKEYDFLYKPGDLSKRPPIVAPHQPRLDWQMWFASLDSYNRNPWLLSLLHKLLVGKTQVIGLLDEGPFEENPPQYIRVDLYRYHFTKNGTSFWNALINSSGERLWWSREYLHEYTPFVLNKNDSKWYEDLIRNRFKLLRTDIPAENSSGLLYTTILSLRNPRQGRFGPQLIVILFTTSLVLLLTKLWWQKDGCERLSPFLIGLNLKLKEIFKKRFGRYRYWFLNIKEEKVRKLSKTLLKWKKKGKSLAIHAKIRPNFKYLKKTR